VSRAAIPSGLLLPARTEPERAVLAVVRHQHGAEADEQSPDRAVVQALTEDPEPSAIAVKMQWMRDVRRHGAGRKWSIRTTFVGRARRVVQVFAPVLVFSLMAGGCGGNGAQGSQVSQSHAPSATSAPAQPAPAPTATAPADTTPATTPASTTPAQTTTLGESQPGGAGDEQGIASQVQYALSGTTATPASASAPAFIRIALTLRSADGRAHAVRVALSTPIFVNVPPGGAATKVLDGQRKGSYAISVDGGPQSAVLVVG
jgi:hypothetical protein